MQIKRETRWVYGWKFPLKPSEKARKGVVTTELPNYPEKRLGRFLYITVSGEHTSNKEQTVLLKCSLETYLLSVSKQKGNLYSDWNQNPMKEFIIKLTF